MLRPAQPARAQRSRAEAETSPFHSFVPLTDDAENRGRPGKHARRGSDTDEPGYWSSRSSRDVCCRKRAPTIGQRRTFMVSVEMRRREEKREERAFQHDSQNLGTRTCVKSLFELFRDRMCVCLLFPLCCYYQTLKAFAKQ